MRSSPAGRIQCPPINTLHANGQRAQLLPSISPFPGALSVQRGALRPLAAAGAGSESSNAGCSQGWGSRGWNVSPRGPCLTNSPALCGHSLRLFGGHLSRDVCLRHLQEGTACRELPYGFNRGVGRTHRQGRGQRGTVGTATWHKVTAQPPREERVAGAGLTLGANSSCPAAPGTASGARLRRSPIGEWKLSVEECRDFCSEGLVCAPGGSHRCPELRKFGPFARVCQGPTEPHGSGVQRGRVPHQDVPSARGEGAASLPWSHREQHPSRAGVSGASETFWRAARVGQRHGEWLPGVTDT